MNKIKRKIEIIYLNDLIAKSKHDGMFGFHPFFHIDFLFVFLLNSSKKLT